MTQHGGVLPSAYFGPEHVPPVAREAGAYVRTSTPIGQPCKNCDHKIVNGDRGWLRAVERPRTRNSPRHHLMKPVHAECELLELVGHDYGLCGCNGYEPSLEVARELWRRLMADAPRQARPRSLP